MDNQRSDWPYFLCNHDKLFIPVSRLTAFSNHPLYIMSNIWSEFANYEMKIQRVKMIFNFMLKSYFMNLLYVIGFYVLAAI